MVWYLMQKYFFNQQTHMKMMHVLGVFFYLYDEISDHFFKKRLCNKKVCYVLTF